MVLLLLLLMLQYCNVMLLYYSIEMEEFDREYDELLKNSYDSLEFLELKHEIIRQKVRILNDNN